MPWKKGESGNPNGRPPVKDSLNNLLRERLEDIDPDTELSNKEIVANELLRLGKAGNLSAIQYIFDRVDGKPTQMIDQHVYQEDNPVLDALRDIIDAESETETVSEGE